MIKLSRIKMTPPKAPAESQSEMALLRQEIQHLRWVIMEMSTLLAEKVMDPDAVNALTKQAWIRSRPTPALTWNAEMTGDVFIGNVRKHVGDDFGRFMEIGPGYGRLMATILGEGVRFSEYLGVDISAESVKFLTGKFGNERTKYQNADFFTFENAGGFDCIISAAVFMHFYPSVEPAMRRCHELLKPGGRLCFDVPTGKARYVDVASKIYVRDYSDPKELVAFAEAAGFRTCTVEREPGFAPGMPGLFVCATK